MPVIQSVQQASGLNKVMPSTNIRLTLLDIATV